jgi:hypothetical protein
VRCGACSLRCPVSFFRPIRIGICVLHAWHNTAWHEWPSCMHYHFSEVVHHHLQVECMHALVTGAHRAAAWWPALCCFQPITSSAADCLYTSVACNRSTTLRCITTMAPCVAIMSIELLMACMPQAAHDYIHTILPPNCAFGGKLTFQAGQTLIHVDPT